MQMHPKQKPLYPRVDRDAIHAIEISQQNLAERVKENSDRLDELDRKDALNNVLLQIQTIDRSRVLKTNLN